MWLNKRPHLQNPRICNDTCETFFPPLYQKSPFSTIRGKQEKAAQTDLSLLSAQTVLSFPAIPSRKSAPGGRETVRPGDKLFYTTPSRFAPPGKLPAVDPQQAASFPRQTTPLRALPPTPTQNQAVREKRRVIDESCPGREDLDLTESLSSSEHSIGQNMKMSEVRKNQMGQNYKAITKFGHKSKEKGKMSVFRDEPYDVFPARAVFSPYSVIEPSISTKGNRPSLRRYKEDQKGQGRESLSAKQDLKPKFQEQIPAPKEKPYYYARVEASQPTNGRCALMNRERRDKKVKERETIDVKQVHKPKSRDNVYAHKENYHNVYSSSLETIDIYEPSEQANDYYTLVNADQRCKIKQKQLLTSPGGERCIKPKSDHVSKELALLHPNLNKWLEKSGSRKISHVYVCRSNSHFQNN